MSIGKLQINKALATDKTAKITTSAGVVLMTPPIDENYWMFRVPVSEKQAIVAFPKFGTIGVGFQYEEDWNTNLPYPSDVNEIYEHIKHNEGDEPINERVVKDAIKTIKAACESYENSQN